MAAGFQSDAFQGGAFQGAGAALVEIFGSPATLTVAGQSGSVAVGAEVLGAAATLRVAGQAGAVNAGASVDGQPATLRVAGQTGTVETGAIVKADFGGHFGLTRRRRRLPKNDRAEIRELLDEVLASPAAPEIEEILDAAVPMPVRTWSAPPVAALDALMGQVEVLQRIIVLQWQAEAEAERQREEEEQMLLLMVL